MIDFFFIIIHGRDALMNKKIAAIDDIDRYMMIYNMYIKNFIFLEISLQKFSRIHCFFFHVREAPIHAFD